MVDTKTVKEWLQRRIDYLEDELEGDRLSLLQSDEVIEFKGMLASYYMVNEFIDGQRR